MMCAIHEAQRHALIEAAAYVSSHAGKVPQLTIHLRKLTARSISHTQGAAAADNAVPDVEFNFSNESIRLASTPERIRRAG
jgi:hypothetical protein